MLRFPSWSRFLCLNLLGRKAGRVKVSFWVLFLNNHLKLRVPKGSFRVIKLWSPSFFVSRESCHHCLSVYFGRGNCCSSCGVVQSVPPGALGWEPEWPCAAPTGILIPLLVKWKIRMTFLGFLLHLSHTQKKWYSSCCEVEKPVLCWTFYNCNSLHSYSMSHPPGSLLWPPG